MAKKELGYKEELDLIQRARAEEIFRTLPDYCDDYYSNIKAKSGVTILTYARHIQDFFLYGCGRKKVQRYDRISGTMKNAAYEPFFACDDPKDVSAAELDKLTLSDINHYLDALGNVNHSTVLNHLCALNSLFSFLWADDRISRNIIEKKSRKDYNATKKNHVVRLNEQYEERFLDSVMSGTGLTKRQKDAHNDLKTRDLAICLTLLRTGLRVSELVGLNIEDLDIEENSMKVIRKRHSVKSSQFDIVYFDDDVREALITYLGTRIEPSQGKGSEPVFVVSTGKYKGERLKVRSVQSIVKKYAIASGIPTGTDISPHKLRATYATSMLRETGNLELVKVEMGHENVQTTSIYIDDDIVDKKTARNILKDKWDRQNKKED